jgi:pseudaminic acid synthase
MSGNHNQSLDQALKIVESAANAGVNAIKLQTYTPDTMTLEVDKPEFYISDEANPWKGHSLYDLYKKAQTPWEWHKTIFDQAMKLGLIAFSTPFDDTAVDFLETLNVPCYKIASFENADIPLIKKVASTGKPIIISTGMATIAELDETVRTARENGCHDIILLKCVSTYPASSKDANIVTIPHMRDLFKCEVGLSDHTAGIGASVASIALGATVIEKHLTLNRNDGGVDAVFSLEPEEMKNLVEESKRSWQALGQISYGPTEKEKTSLKFRRSLYITQNMNAGDILSEDNVRSIRPGYGLQTKYLDLVLGKMIKQDVKKGTALQWDFINP